MKSTRWFPTRRRGEDGQIIVLWALGLIAIVLFAALAIDLGNTGQVKQSSQDAADSAALDGAQLLAEGNSQATVVTDVESYITNNYPQMSSSPNWASCPLPPSGFTAVSGETCISFDNYIVNVNVPPQLVQFWFGPVGGVNSQGIQSSATASAQAPGGEVIVPIGITPAAAAAGLTCIKGGSNGSSCVNNVAAGDRGNLDDPRLRSFTGATESGHGSNNEVVELDFATGLDHNLNIYSSSATNSYCDANSGTSGATSGKCNSAASPSTGSFDSLSTATYDSPSLVWLLSGSVKETENGLVDGDSSVDSTDGPFTLAPRLAHNPSYQATGTNSATADPADSPLSPTLSNSADGISYGGTLDGVQISYYLESTHGAPTAGQTEFTKCFGSGPSPDTVAVDKFTGGNDVWNADDSCFVNDLTSASPPFGSGPIFSTKIASSPRFGYVPVVNNCGPGTSSFCQIVGFEAIYFDYISIQGNNLSATAWVFNPDLVQNGPAPPGEGNGGFSGHGAFEVNLCSIPKGNC